MRFHPAATQAKRQAAIDAVSGRVIGGGRLHGVDGYYIVLLPRDTTHTKLFAALDVIRPMHAVQRVLPDYVEPLDNTPIASPWPVLTDHLPDLDVSRVVMMPPDTFKWFRTDISLHFKSTVSDSAKAAFFTRHQMTVIGVTTAGRFFVRIPDPGNTVDALFKAVDAIRHEPEVAIAGAVARSQLREVY